MYKRQVVGIYRIKQTPIQAMMMGSGDTKSGYIPYTILTWPNDYFSQLNFFAKEGTNMKILEQKMKDYVAKQKGRPTSEITFYSAQDELGNWDSMMGGLSIAVGGIAAISLLVGGIGIMNIMLVSVTAVSYTHLNPFVLFSLGFCLLCVSCHQFKAVIKD